MIQKLCKSFIFLLLILQSLKAEGVNQLDCGTLTPRECKNKFRELFKDILHMGNSATLRNFCDMFIEIIEESSAPKYLGERAIDFLNDIKRRVVVNQNNLPEINKLYHEAENYDQKFADLVPYILDYLEHTSSSDLDPKPYRTKALKEVVINTVELFAGLRPEDFKEFEEMRNFKFEFGTLKLQLNAIKHYSSEYNELVEKFAAYLGIPRHDLFLAGN